MRGDAGTGKTTLGLYFLVKKTESLENANRDLERFTRIATGREMRIIELKNCANGLGKPPRYSLGFVDEDKR